MFPGYSNEPGMHFDGDFHAVILRKLGVLGPVGITFFPTANPERPDIRGGQGQTCLND